MVSLETERLAAFLRDRGAFVHDALELFGSSGSSGSRGVFAVEPIAKGALLLRLPAEAVLRACDNGPECEWMPDAARNASPMLRTALYLMREEALGPTSEWAPYVKSLPAAYDTLEQWSQDELAALSGTAVHDELSGLRDASGALLLAQASSIARGLTGHEARRMRRRGAALPPCGGPWAASARLAHALAGSPTGWRRSCTARGRARSFDV